jgi:membrane protein
VERRRSFLKASTVFAGVIVWMPLFIGLSIYLTREFATRTQTVTTNFMNFLPFFLVFLGFSLAYWLIPNTRVHLTSALAAGFFTAFFWEVARSIFDRSIQMFPALSLVQNIGAIPYFLVWLYINWIIILLGVIIAYCLQNYRLLLREDISYSARVLDPVVLLMMLFYVGKRFLAGGGAVDIAELRNLCPISPKSFLQHIDYLEKCGFIMVNNESESIILAQPPHKIMLDEILQFSKKAKTMFHFSAIDRSGQIFLERLHEIETKLSSSMSNKTLLFFLESEDTGEKIQ